MSDLEKFMIEKLERNSNTTQKQVWAILYKGNPITIDKKVSWDSYEKAFNAMHYNMRTEILKEYARAKSCFMTNNYIEYQEILIKLLTRPGSFEIRRVV